MGLIDTVFKGVTAGMQPIISAGINNVMQQAADTEVPLSEERKQDWEKTEYTSEGGERQDNYSMDTSVESNEHTLSEFHVYQNIYGRYQMADDYRNACEDIGMTPNSLWTKYADTSSYLTDSLPGTDLTGKAIYADIRMWEQAHDPAYLSSLDSEGLTMFMESYAEWEQEHVIAQEDGSAPRVVFGATLEEYAGLSSDDKQALDMRAAECAQNWDVVFDHGTLEYQPEIEEPNQETEATKETGFWANLKSQVSDGMTMVRTMLESTSVGAWVVGVYDNVKEGAQNLLGIEKEETPSMSESYEIATGDTDSPDINTDGTEKETSAEDEGRGSEKYVEGDFSFITEAANSVMRAAVEVTDGFSR